MKFIFLCLVFLSSSMAKAESAAVIHLTVEQALDDVLNCHPTYGVTGNVAGNILGRWLYVRWARGTYNDDYITPLMKAAAAGKNVADYEVKASEEYKKLTLLLQTDENFTLCPDRAELFVQAIDLQLADILVP